MKGNLCINQPLSLEDKDEKHCCHPETDEDRENLLQDDAKDFCKDRENQKYRICVNLREGKPLYQPIKPLSLEEAVSLATSSDQDPTQEFCSHPGNKEYPVCKDFDAGRLLDQPPTP